MENPLELEVVKLEIEDTDRHQVWIQGFGVGACVGVGETEKEALQDAASALEASLKLIQENPQRIERITNN